MSEFNFHDHFKIVPFKILVQMATDVEVGMADFQVSDDTII